MKKIVFLFFLIVCMFFIETLYAEKTRFSNEQDVTIILDGIPRIAAQEVIEIYPRVKRELEKTFKWKLNIAPTILLTNNKKTFQEITAHKLIVAVALPQKNLIVIDYSRTVARPYTFSMILKHELCHILLHQHITHGNMPRWLDEGVSQWASSGISEILINTKHSVLDEAIIAGHYISMRNLTERFPEDEKPLLLAYAESKSFVEYIVSKYGSNALLEVLAYLKEGDEIHLALRKGLSIPLEELERRWLNHLQQKITWFTYLINNLYEILFFLAALITIFGFIRRLKKRKAYDDDEDDDHTYNGMLTS